MKDKPEMVTHMRRLGQKITGEPIMIDEKKEDRVEEPAESQQNPQPHDQLVNFLRNERPFHDDFEQMEIDDAENVVAHALRVNNLYNPLVRGNSVHEDDSPNTIRRSNVRPIIKRLASNRSDGEDNWVENDEQLGFTQKIPSMPADVPKAVANSLAKHGIIDINAN